jgi:EmrB/QacA subfamily drug resistance transporter
VIGAQGGAQQGTRPGLLLGVLLTAGGAYSLLQSLVVPALPTLQRELKTTSTGVAWVFTAFLLAACVATPLAGRLGDMLGKKRVLVVVLLALVLGTLLAGLARSLPLLIVARAIQGIGGAVFPLAFGIIRDEMPRQRVSGGIAWMSAVLGLGGVLGIVLAGPVLENLSYHWLFWIPLGVAVVAVVATIVVVPESTVRAPGDLNWTAALLFSSSLTSLLFAVNKAPAWGWASSRTIGLAAVSCLLAAAWVRRERTARQPYIDLRVVFLSGLRATNLAALLIGWGMYSGFVLLPQYVEAPKSTGYGFGLSVTRAGLFLLPWTFALLVSSPVGGRMSAHMGSKWPLAVGSTTGVAGFLFLVVEHSRVWELCLASGIVGTGVGLAFASLANLVVESVPQTDTGAATGVNIIMRTIGGVVGTQVGVSIVAAITSTTTGLAAQRGYLIVFAISAVALGLATVAALLAPSRPPIRAGAATMPQLSHE